MIDSPTCCGSFTFVLAAICLSTIFVNQECMKLIFRIVLKTNLTSVMLSVALMASLSVSSVAQATLWSQIHPNAVSEEECTTVDLRPAFGPARNQGNIGWCYANVTADLLSFKYRTELHGERVSSGFTALTFNHVNAKAALTEGGYVDRAVQATASEGLCPESLEQEVMGAGPKMRIKQKLESFIAFKKIYDRARLDPKLLPAFRKQLVSYRDSKSALFTLKQDEMFSLLRNTTVDNFPLEFGRLLCRGHRVEATGPAPVMISRDKEDFGGFANKLAPSIHRQLEDGQPVAIGYAAQFLNNANVPDWRFSWHRLINLQNDPVSRHASMIVGRRLDPSNKRCEFILRNSWGTSCSVYQNPYFKKHCEAGHLFVPETFLETQMYRVLFFDNSFIKPLFSLGNG